MLIIEFAARWETITAMTIKKKDHKRHRSMKVKIHKDFYFLASSLAIICYTLWEVFVKSFGKFFFVQVHLSEYNWDRFFTQITRC